MNRLIFKTNIKAKKITIWQTLWEEGSYRNWVKVFGEGSYMKVESWEENSKVQFLDANHNGIYSSIEKYLSNQLVRFNHIGSIIDGKEQPIDIETKKWSGAKEEYRIEEGGNHNTLVIEIDIMDEHLEFMKDRLPKALETIKENAEKQM